MAKKIIYSWVTDKTDDEFGDYKIRWAISKKAADTRYNAKKTRERVVFVDDDSNSVMPSCHSRAAKAEWLNKDKEIYRKWSDRRGKASEKEAIKLDMEFDAELTSLAFDWLMGNVD